MGFMARLKLEIRQALAADEPAIEAVLDATFGTDRHERTAYRVRAGMAPILSLSFVAETAAGIIGSLQCWPVELRDGAKTTPLVMLGPVAVLPGLQRSGVGKALMKYALAAADREGVNATMLIGDAEYYGRFGFDAAPTQRWELPGPVERHRLLLRVAPGVTLPDRGSVGPRQAARHHAA